MKKIFFLFTFTLFTVSAVNAQKVKVNSAWNFLTYYTRDGEKDALEKAKVAIDEALQHPDTKEEAATWKYAYMIYGAVAQDKEYKLKYPDAAATTALAMKKCLELDTKGKYKDDILSGVKQSTFILFNSAVEAYKKNDFETAYKTMSQVVEMNEFARKYDPKTPIDTSAYIVTAYSAEKTNNNETATKIYEKLVAIECRDPAVYQSLIRHYRDAKKNTEADALLAKALVKFPNNQEFKIEELNTMLVSGNSGAAVKKLEEAIASDPKNPELYYALGSTYDNLKDFDNAKKAYEKAIELKPNYFDVNYNLAALIYNQAIDYNKKMNDVPLDDETNYNKYKTLRDDKFKEALPVFEKAYQLDPNDLNCKVALKEIYTRTNNNTKATEMQLLLDKK